VRAPAALQKLSADPKIIILQLMPLRIYFARHRESEANVLRIFSNRGWKHPLTDRGRAQVIALGEKLKTRGIVAIYSSPLQRAVESAQIIAEMLRIPHEVEPALIEYHVGIYEGRPYDHHVHEYDRVEERWSKGEIHARLEEGESSCDICARVEPFIRQLIAKYAPRENAGILLVGHGGTFRQAIPAVVTNITREFAHQRHLANAASVEAELHDGSLRCVRWADEIIP
jgi:broad specificity phosphatase PhoE